MSGESDAYSDDSPSSSSLSSSSSQSESKSNADYRKARKQSDDSGSGSDSYSSAMDSDSSGRDCSDNDSIVESGDEYSPFEPKDEKVKYYVALANLIDSDEERTEVGQRIMKLANSLRGKDVAVLRNSTGEMVVQSTTQGMVQQVRLSDLAREA